MDEPSPTTGTPAGAAGEPPAPPGAPRWVKVFGIVVAVVALLFVLLLFAGGGSHGPGRHLPSGAGGDTSPAAYGLQQR